MGGCPWSVRDGMSRDAASFGWLVAVALLDAALQAGLAGVRLVQTAADQGVEPVDHPPPAVGDQLDFLGVAGLEPDGRAARQVEPHAVRLHPVEDERLVDLEEVVVRTDLHRPVAGVVDAERHDGAAGVELEVAARQ